MTKARKQTKNPVKFILDVAELKQKEFAEMIGASLDTVKGWTRKKNPTPISKQFQIRIFVAAGAVIRWDGSVSSHPINKEFTKASFDYWRENCFPTSEAVATLYAEQAMKIIGRLFEAASQPVRGKKNKLPALVESFNDWLLSTMKEFSLWRQLGHNMPPGRGKIFTLFEIPSTKRKPPSR